MLLTFESDIVKISASRLKEMNLAEVIRYIWDQPMKIRGASFESLHIYVSELDQEIPIQISITVKAGEA